MPQDIGGLDELVANFLRSAEHEKLVLSDPYKIVVLEEAVASGIDWWGRY